MGENRRKRMKKETEKCAELSAVNTHTITDRANDDLNTAFRLCEEEVIKPIQSSANESNKISPANNKENVGNAKIMKESKPFVAPEKSPSVLFSPSSIVWIQSKRSAKNETSRRLIDNRSKLEKTRNPKCEKKPSATSTREASVKLQRMLNTASNDNSPIDEANRMQMNQQPSTSKIKPKPVRKQSPLDDNVIDLTEDSNKIITINESPPTMVVKPHVSETKTRFIPELQPQKSTRKKTILSKECGDCNKYHRGLGRDVNKNPPKKFGVCSKHHRNVSELETPPGFWNPKIIDSDSDHEDTPYDYRFAKK